MLGKNGNLSCGVPLAQRIARWTSNPKVLGSIPRWDGSFLLEIDCLWPDGRVVFFARLGQLPCFFGLSILVSPVRMITRHFFETGNQEGSVAERSKALV